MYGGGGWGGGGAAMGGGAGQQQQKVGGESSRVKESQADRGRVSLQALALCAQCMQAWGPRFVHFLPGNLLTDMHFLKNRCLKMDSMTIKILKGTEQLSSVYFEAECLPCCRGLAGPSPDALSPLEILRGNTS